MVLCPSLRLEEDLYLSVFLGSQAEVLDIDFCKRNEGQGRRIKRTSAESSPLYFLILLGVTDLQPLPPCQLFSSASALSYSFDEISPVSGFVESLLAPGIPKKLCVVWMVMGGREKITQKID